MSLMAKHEILEKNSILLLIGILLVISIGGLVEIAPLFYLKSTIEKVEGMRPYTPLELAGRDIYVREGCYTCHSQQIRPLRDEVERYGHYSLAAESMYDHPFQWGSKRTGPDLSRVGGKYSDEWHVAHLKNPRAVVPQSVMPGYPFLAKTELDPKAVAAQMETLRIVGVPYTDDQIKNAAKDLKIQATLDDPAVADLQGRYPKSTARDYDGNPSRVTEMDALVAYLQMLGTLVDLKLYDDKANLR
ncbi:cytochrome-c oxidase, cbb3-type subunit II [Rhodoplanes elegans]|uniref:Cytochrome-c oxidase, cbb3-type subunit II n=1 Tax=Rhodoplanes elegans TaxID=29408 RepID=A0A327KKA4_9BRAD|nr:cytochrome-c oxidase, cbb3-type subunit II [Rhodoplanes elegans]MBK5959099.1 cytochrome-c oxidase, cbb3-type subunit II [Rhodoplanes elegans]RAI38526.1 cytochrome-c oxidase, cbb3-type subunit II [Rhodoplanes elegans]